MTVCGLMLVKDEIDVIEWSVRWLVSQVDHVIVADNGSTDGTRELLEGLAAGSLDSAGLPLTIVDDPIVGYYQDDKMSDLAGQAYERGFEWVVPCDADEFWRLNDPADRLGDYLDGLDAEWRFVEADLYDHKVTPLDHHDEPDPSRRMPWRFVLPVGLPKVAARTSPALRIAMGNHSASAKLPTVASSTGSPPTRKHEVVVEHYGWRSREQFARKIANGYRAYKAAEGREAFGDHWKNFGPPDDAQFLHKAWRWFDDWAFAAVPGDDPEIGRYPWRKDPPA